MGMCDDTLKASWGKVVETTEAERAPLAAASAAAVGLSKYWDTPDWRAVRRIKCHAPKLK